MIDYLSRLKLDYSTKLYPSTKSENLSTFIKSLKMKRLCDARDVQKIWSPTDCHNDPDVEFYCNGRLPVFSRWDTENTKQVEEQQRSFFLSIANLRFVSFFAKFGRQVVLYLSDAFIRIFRKHSGSPKHSKNT